MDNLKYFASREEFWQAFERFNILYGEGLGWRDTYARAEQEDFFGIQINRADTYFRRVGNGTYSAAERLSMSSMEKILYLVLNQNPQLNRLGEQLIEAEWQKIVAAVNRMDTAETPPPRADGQGLVPPPT